jgi:hypothetical protein
MLTACRFHLQTIDESSYRDCIRAAWLLHGREMVHSAAESDYPGCVAVSAGPEAWSQCEIRRNMARVGARYVEVAGSDTNAMKENWDEVLRENILRPLLKESETEMHIPLL